MRRVVGVGVLLIALLTALLLWRRQRDGPAPEPSAAPRSMAVPLRSPSEDPEWLGQPGVAPRRIAGVVRRDGKPARLAEVRLGLGSLLMASVLADRDGRFDFGPRPATTYTVTAVAAGTPGATESVDLADPLAKPAPDRLELELGVCEAFIHGIVRDVSGGVIAGAEVRAIGVAVTDDAGAYELCVPYYQPEVEVSADGYATARVTALARKRMRVDIELVPEVVIAGRVVSGSDPVPGALVTAENEGDWRLPARPVRAAADGTFRLEGLAPNSYPWRIAAISDGKRASRAVVVGKPGLVEEGVILSLEDLVRLRGRVVERGRPVSRLSLWLWADLDGGSGGATTQVDGRFELVAPAKVYTLHVGGHRLLAPQVVDLGALSGELTVTVEPLGRIAGRVVRGGAAAPRASVRADSSSDKYGRATADAQGNFTMEGLKAGTYEINADSARRDAMASKQTVTLRDGENREGIVVDLNLAATIAGTVVDTSGIPIAGAEVTFSLLEGRDFGIDVTGEDGTFRAAGMSGGGNYAVTVRASPRKPMALPAPSGSSLPVVFVRDGATHVEGLRIVVDNRRKTIAGRVLRGRKPAPDVSITAQVDGEKVSNDDAGSTLTDAEGAFSLDDLATGKYVLIANAANGELEIVRAMAGDQDVRIDLAELGTIEGTLVGFRGDVTVEAFGYGGRTQTTTSGDRFTLENIPAGEIRVVATASGSGDNAVVDVLAGKTTRVVLRSLGTGRVEGVARDLRTRQPVVGAVCEARLGGAETHTDEAARFELTVPAGKDVDVTCRKDYDERSNAGSLTVKLVDGGHAVVEIPFLFRQRGDRDGQRVGFRFGPDAVVTEVNGSVATGGVRVGDRLLLVDDFAVTGLDVSLIDLLLTDRPVGGATPVTVKRGDAQMKLEVPVGSYPRPK